MLNANVEDLAGVVALLLIVIYSRVSDVDSLAHCEAIRAVLRAVVIPRPPSSPLRRPQHHSKHGNMPIPHRRSPTPRLMHDIAECRVCLDSGNVRVTTEIWTGPTGVSFTTGLTSLGELAGHSWREWVSAKGSVPAFCLRGGSHSLTLPWTSLAFAHSIQRRKRVLHD